jgi:hypothetical protein
VYRPQFALPPAPEGFLWQPCIYQFDITNTPALGSLALAKGQESGRIPLELDRDAPFTLLACKIANSGLNIRLTDPWGDEMMDDYVSPALYASELPPATVLEGPGIEVPAGAVFTVRFQGQ